MHIDMDAFFASVEQYRVHPEYCGLPLCVGHDPKGGTGRGVVRAVSYEARAFGIRSGMPVTEAYRLCPDALFVSGPFSNYSEASEEFMEILPEFADGKRVRRASIDEAYIEVTQSVKKFQDPKDLALTLQKTIKKRTKLPCSIGIAPNMAVAKIATGQNKPYGITLVPQDPRSVAKFLEPLVVRVVSGIGKVTAQRLEQHGITTLGQIQHMTLAELQPIMGKGSSWLRKRAWGIDDRPLKDNGPRVRKSISKDRTFMEDIDPKNIDFLQGTLDNLCSRIWQKVQSKDFLFRTVTVKMRYGDYTTIQRSKTLPVGTGEQGVLCKTAFDLFETKRQPDQPIRLLGVKVSNLIRLEDQTNLSDYI
jgi:DNA polymerase IV (DinB-like DNA polymerase)